MEALRGLLVWKHVLRRTVAKAAIPILLLRQIASHRLPTPGSTGKDFHDHVGTIFASFGQLDGAADAAGCLADPYTLGLDDRADDYLRTRHFVS
jgi:hypothetical protein